MKGDWKIAVKIRDPNCNAQILMISGGLKGRSSLEDSGLFKYPGRKRKSPKRKKFWIQRWVQSIIFNISYLNYRSSILRNWIILKILPSAMFFLSDSIIFQAKNFWVDFNVPFSAYKAKKSLQLLFRKFDKKPVITITGCYCLLLSRWRPKTLISDWAILEEIGRKVATNNDFLWAVGKKLGILLIVLALDVEAISRSKLAQIKSWPKNCSKSCWVW